MSYGDATFLQQELVALRRAGDVPDQLLLLEHPHVITLGSGADRSHVVARDADLDRLGIELHDSGRGGDVTYHGPGQLVGYPILDLGRRGRDLHRYLRDLEEALIGALGSMDVAAERVDGLTGVWSAGRKVAAIGIRVSSGWISSHGFALNVDPDLSYFDTIVPCGIRGREVTSVAELLGGAPPAAEVEAAVIRAFASVFGYADVVVQATKQDVPAPPSEERGFEDR